MKAYLKNYRQAPRKVRLVANAVRGKSVNDAVALLAHTPNRAASALSTLIKSAVANATQSGKKGDELFVKTISVDKGMTLHRSMPRAFGRATPIRKQASHIDVQLAERSQGETSNSQETSTKEEAATAKK